MKSTSLELNAISLEAEMNWLLNVIKTRMDLRFNQTGKYSSVYDVPLPALEEDSYYSRIITHCDFGFKERIILALSIAPHIKPQVLDRFFLKNKMV